MWLMTQSGFFSIVRKAPGTFPVRSREIRDIENLVRHVPLPGARILDTTGRDYSARIIVGPEEVASRSSLADALSAAATTHPVWALPRGDLDLAALFDAGVEALRLGVHGCEDCVQGVLDHGRTPLLLR